MVFRLTLWIIRPTDQVGRLQLQLSPAPVLMSLTF
jgi:hypothetical protein